MLLMSTLYYPPINNALGKLRLTVWRVMVRVYGFNLILFDWYVTISLSF